jgi:hypothetical protein
VHRFYLTLAPKLERHLRDTKLATGDVAPFSRFLVRLIELGLEQLDAKFYAELVELAQIEDDMHDTRE